MCIRDRSDIVARLGGDEFVVALPLVASDQDTEQVARKIMAAVAEPFDIEGHELHINTSLGICHYPIAVSYTHLMVMDYVQKGYIPAAGGTSSEMPPAS